MKIKIFKDNNKVTYKIRISYSYVVGEQNRLKSDYVSKIDSDYNTYSNGESLEFTNYDDLVILVDKLNKHWKKHVNNNLNYIDSGGYSIEIISK